MKYIERCNIIQSILAEKKEVSIHQLIELLEASPATIRRDIKRMESDNLLKRYHGGIRHIDVTKPIPINTRNAIKSHTKNQIGKYAAELVQNNQIIFLDSSSTAAAMINYLNNKNITVVTNGLMQARMCKQRGINCFIVPGFLYHHENTILGAETEKAIINFHYDCSFIGAQAFNNNHVMCSDQLEYNLKLAIASVSENTYILADSSKFSNKSLFRVDFPDRERITIITNKSMPSFDYFEIIVAPQID